MHFKILIFILGLLYPHSVFTSKGKCPCVPLFQDKEGTQPSKVCGWQINNQLKTTCGKNTIYEGCKSRNETTGPGKVVDECPNECINKRQDKTSVCGVCKEWSPNQVCLSIEKESSEPEKVEKDHLDREAAMKNKKLTAKSQSGPEEPEELLSMSQKEVRVLKFGDQFDILDNPCDVDWLKEIDLEIVFVQKANIEYTSTQENEKSFKQLLREQINDIVNVTRQSFPTAKFGLTSFSDWEERTGEHHDYCYFCVCALRLYDEETSMRNCIADIPEGTGLDEKDSSLTALFYSALDQQMGWSSGLFTSDGRRILKILVVLTSGPWMTYHWVRTEDKHGGIWDFPLPKGDGNDDCSFNAPRVGQLKKVMEDEEFFLVGFIGNSEYENKWKDYVKQLGAEETSYLAYVGANEKDRVRDVPRIALYLAHAIKTLACKKFFPAPFNILGL